MRQDIFKKTGLRKTPLRIELWKLFEQTHTLLSVTEIEEQLPIEASTSTIYRALESFLNHGLIQQIHLLESTSVLYEKVHEEHCHHLICTKCGKVIHVHHCPLHLYEVSVKEEFAFEVQSHQLNLYGLCKQCQEEKR